jgi:hypothetical protein
MLPRERGSYDCDVVPEMNAAQSGECYQVAAIIVM